MIDEYSGQGGSYIFDPETGKRTLIRRTLPTELSKTNGTSSTETIDSDRGGIDLRNGSESDGNGSSPGEGSVDYSAAE